MIPVRLVGSAARRALAPGGGRVLAVFRRSIYLERSDGALACLGPPALGAGPLNALGDLPEEFGWEERGIAPGAPFVCAGEEVRVAGGISFGLREARDWKARPLPPDWGPADLVAGLAALARTVRPPNEGMGGLIPELILPLLHRRGVPWNAPTEGVAETDGFFHSAARAGALALEEWMTETLRGASPPPPKEAGSLIGLGPGLTPSGDDYLGGAMIALRSLGESQAADRLAAWVLPLARARTGKISLAHLACAAEGEGASALHDALAALCAPGAPGLAEALAAVHAIGHTSGWDALAGAAAACAAWLGERIRTRPGFEGRAPAPV